MTSTERRRHQRFITHHGGTHIIVAPGFGFGVLMLFEQQLGFFRTDMHLGGELMRLGNNGVRRFQKQALWLAL